MAAGGGGGRHDDKVDEAPGPPGADADLYAVLGLSRECSDADLKVAYRKLAKTWHPDKCAAPGSSARVEEAKERFQEIQGAYSVLSDTNKRLLYDVGVYDGDDDEGDLSGMGDFLGEMAQMMSQATPTESFEDLQQLFVDMFQDDLDAGCFSGPDMGFWAQPQTQSPPYKSSSSSPPPARTHAQAPLLCKGVNMRCSPAMDSDKSMSPEPVGSSLGLDLPGLFFKGGDSRQSRAPPRTPNGSIGGRRRKQMSPVKHDVLSDGEASHAHQSQRQRTAF